MSQAELRPVLDAAAQHACAVDRDARFPAEALAAMREARLMSALVPATLGGRDMPLKTVVSVCEALARECASSAMMFAMHQAATACLIAHEQPSPGSKALLEQLATEQLLFGVADTVAAGAAVGGSECAQASLDVDSECFTLTIDNATIPYGAYADGLLLVLPSDVVLREAALDVTSGGGADHDAGFDPATGLFSAVQAPDLARVFRVASGEGAFVAVLRDQCELDRRESWDALGMRGLCSDEFRVTAHGGLDQIMPPLQQGGVPNVSAQPVAQLLYSAVWVGIAADALERARACFRAGVRVTHGMSGTARLAEADALLQMMSAHLSSAVEQVARARRAGPVWNRSLVVDMNALKTGVSKSALALVNHAMMVCGIEGYRNDTDVSVARHLRDLYAAPLAIDVDCSATNPAGPVLPEPLSKGAARA